MLNKIWKVIKHNHVFVGSLVVCVILTIWFYGCQPQTASPFDPDTKITREQLDIDVKAMADKIALAYMDIQKQEQIRAAILNAGLAYIKGEGLNPIGLVTTLTGILGLGAVLDNRRKNSVIVSKDNALKQYHDAVRRVNP